MSWALILLIVLVIACFGAAPWWPYSRSWGPAPGAVLLVATILVALKVFRVI